MLASGILFNLSRIALVALPLGITSYFAYDVGCTLTSRDYQSRLDHTNEEHAKQLAGIAQEKATALATAMAEQERLNEQAHQVGWGLLQAQARLSDAQQRLKERIHHAHALAADGAGFTGLGPDGLRLYRAALGYPERDPGVSEANAGAAAQAATPTGTEAGLSPEDILAHAADYGEYCQRLDAHVDALITLQAGKAQP